ncbi:hypothetical protein A3731_28465 [Roseovarius sp. HI0049]|nr:hypothetical protein A3731_28465 [Roseovarius sp. HI0049]
MICYRFFLLGLALALPAAGMAQSEAPVWAAVSGDEVVLDGETYRLSGVSCPDPATETGRAAKALLNTFLRGGYIECRVEGGRASCSKEGRDIATGLIRSGYCEGTGEAPVAEEEDVLARDTRPGTVAGEARAGECDPAQASRRFIAQSQAFACDAGSPYSTCDGVNGKRQFGRHVAGSDNYRATGQTAPSFRPGRCN